jgi:hypothetical protein
MACLCKDCTALFRPYFSQYLSHTSNFFIRFYIHLALSAKNTKKQGDGAEAYSDRMVQDEIRR